MADKLTIAALLDELGVGFIEGGWPGANPTDTGILRRDGRRGTDAEERPAGVFRLYPARG